MPNIQIIFNKDTILIKDKRTKYSIELAKDVLPELKEKYKLIKACLLSESIELSNGLKLVKNNEMPIHLFDPNHFKIVYLLPYVINNISMYVDNKQVKRNQRPSKKNPSSQEKKKKK